MNLLDLIDFIVAREKSEKREDLEEDAAYSPHIHFVIIVAVCEQTFGGSVPSGRDVFLE